MAGVENIPAPAELQVEVVPDPWQESPGPILLLAGPGTGKTHQLARRIKDLVEIKQVSPDSITVISFTREAAGTMRDRVSDEGKADVYIPSDKRPGRITTMHSVGLEILRLYASSLGLPDEFEVVTDTGLRKALLRDAALLAGSDEKTAVIADKHRQESRPSEPGSPVAKVIESYEILLRANRAIDYDDQVTLACRLLAEHPDVLDEYSKGTQHLLIDEYQDINPGQRELIRLLSTKAPGGLFVVGDDDQSIYSFRGGTPKYIRDFRGDFGREARILCLVESRRCPDTVTHAALSIVSAFDSGRVKKPAPTFKPEKTNGTPVQVHDVPTDDYEASVIAGLVRKSLPRKSVLVLVPAKQYAEKIKQQLRRQRIAYDHPPAVDDGGLVLLELAHRWRQAPEDNFALRACIEALCERGTIDIPSRKAGRVNLRETARFCI